MQTARDYIKTLSSKDFMMFGIDHVAYIRPVSIGKRTVFSIHMANGSELGVVENESSAHIALQLSDIQPLTVH